MTGIRVIPVTALGHAADCLICAVVDRWAANRRPRASGVGSIARPGAPAEVAEVRSDPTPDSRERIPGLRRSG